MLFAEVFCELHVSFFRSHTMIQMWKVVLYYWPFEWLNELLYISVVRFTGIGCTSICCTKACYWLHALFVCICEICCDSYCMTQPMPMRFIRCYLVLMLSCICNMELNARQLHQ